MFHPTRKQYSLPIDHFIVPKRIPRSDAVLWIIVRTRIVRREERTIVLPGRININAVPRNQSPNSVLLRQRPHAIGMWTAFAAWIFTGLAGCATFDSKYEKVELSGPETSPVTSRKPVKARDRGTPNKTDQKPVKLTARKPVTTGKATLTPKSALKPTIQQVAYFQNEPDKKDKPGNDGPNIERGDSKEPASAPPAPLTLPEGTAVDTAIEIDSPEGAQGITLDQAINQCLIADPVIHAGLESINQANADSLTASLKPNPQLFTDGQLLPLTRPFTVTKQGGPPQVDAIVAYPIDWFLFGKRAAAMQAANLGVQISQSEYEDLIRVRVLEAATAFYGVLEAKSLLGVARQDTANFTRIEALTSAAVDNGGRPQVELNRIRLDRLRSEQSLRDAENALIGANARLRVLLGRDDSDPAFEVIGSLEAANLIEPLPVDEAIELADQNRPDLEAARWRIAQADAVIELERRKAFPTIVPAFGYTKQYQVKAIGMPDADSWLANVTMSVPLFDRNQGNRQKASSLAAQAGFQLQARRVALRGEVERTTQDLNTSAANAKAVAQEQLQIAQQVRDSINSAYEAGGQPLIDVLDAQRNYRETYRQFITSRANYHRAAIQYSATLGRQMPQ